MSTILHIDSNVRPFLGEGVKHSSLSKMFGQHFIQQWKEKYKHDDIIYRDVGSHPPTFISQKWIEAVFLKTEDRNNEQQKILAESDQLIEEVRLADIILITTPMYNYGMPATLKAWFDQIIRINKTFTFDLSRGDTPLMPIFSNKTLILLSSCGEFGFGKGEMREHMNHLGTHIQVLSKYLGVEHFYEVRSEYQEFADQRHQQSLQNAKISIDKLLRDYKKT